MQELVPLRRFLERACNPPIPLILGCIPLHSSRHAEYLHNEVPGITIPEDVRTRMRAAGEHGHEEGFKIAQELLSAARSIVQGVYLMPSYARYDVVSELTKMLVQPTQRPRPEHPLDVVMLTVNDAASGCIGHSKHKLLQPMIFHRLSHYASIRR